MTKRNKPIKNKLTVSEFVKILVKQTETGTLTKREHELLQAFVMDQDARWGYPVNYPANTSKK